MLKEAINILKDLTSSSNVMGGILNQFPFLRYLFPRLTGFSMFAERQSRINSFFIVSFTDEILIEISILNVLFFYVYIYRT